METQKRACAGFCVNGHLAGNCRPVRSHNAQQEARREVPPVLVPRAF